MAPTALLTPTLHIEVMLTSQPPRLVADAIRQAVADFVRAEFEAVPVGKEVAAFGEPAVRPFSREAGSDVS